MVRNAKNDKPYLFCDAFLYVMAQYAFVNIKELPPRGGLVQINISTFQLFFIIIII